MLETMIRASRLVVLLCSGLVVSSPLTVPAKYQQKKFNELVRDNKSNLVRLALYLPRIDPAAEDNEAIQLACRYGNLPTVEVLLSDERVNPSSNDNRSLEYAIIGGHLEVFHRLLRDDRVSGRSCLLTALHFNEMEMFEVLCEDSSVTDDELIKARQAYHFRF